MKLIILRNNLLEGLAIIERAIGLTANLPILKNLLLRAEENRIIAIATNLEFAVRHNIPGKIIEGGEYTIPFSILNSIAKNITSERITLEEKDKKMYVSTDNYEAIIQGQGSKDFPLIPSILDTGHSIKLSQALLREALEETIVAVQYSEIRPEISGILFKYEQGDLVLVGTDSFRLVERKLTTNDVKTTLESFSFILPLRTAEELLRIFLRGNGDVEIFVDPNQILFKNENTELISRLIDGNFPEYKGIIPKEIKTEAIIETQELIGAVKLTASFSGRTQGIAFIVGDGKKFVELHSADSALGENRYRVPIKLKGDTFSAVFNWKYLLDGLRIFKEEEVRFGITAPDRPIVMRSSVNSSLLYLLMPIKV